MTAHWTYLDGEGAERGRSEDFEDRDEAEDWLGRAWRELLDDGVMAVRLVDSAAEGYTMKLTAT